MVAEQVSISEACDAKLKEMQASIRASQNEQDRLRDATLQSPEAKSLFHHQQVGLWAINEALIEFSKEFKNIHAAIGRSLVQQAAGGQFNRFKKDVGEHRAI